MAIQAKGGQGMKPLRIALCSWLVGACLFVCPALAQDSGIFAFGQEATESENEPDWHFSLEQARQIGESIGIDWDTAPFSVKQFRVGLEVELEHGSRDPQTDITHNDPILTAKVALAHLKELSDYYYRLALMEGDDAYLQELLGTSKP
jgi:hypothetical protein